MIIMINYYNNINDTYAKKKVKAKIINKTGSGCIFFMLLSEVTRKTQRGI